MLFLKLLLAALPQAGNATHLRNRHAGRRHLFSDPYYTTNDYPGVLGAPNVNIAIGNPLKGLYGGVRWSAPPLVESIPLSLEWYNIGLDELMIGNDEFDWRIMEDILDGSASRKMHAAISVFVHWPGKPLRLPPHLVGEVELREYIDQNKETHLSPYYGDKDLLTALEQFIKALAANYDGDTRLGVIQVGLLGYWGEFHTFPYDYVPESSKDDVIGWYSSSFKTTQISARYARASTVGLGHNDGSFASNTLDGAYNGGFVEPWYFWPAMEAANQTDFWRTGIMGGETRPEIQHEVFTEEYPGGTYEHQWFSSCVAVTHASYILHHDAFANGGYSGTELANAREMHAFMGYSFFVSEVAVASSPITASTVDIEVTVKQIGVAPFYYDLSLALACPGISAPRLLPGVDKLIEFGENRAFLFAGIPATEECLNAVSLSLSSSYAYEGRPVRFAQGTDGTIELNLPLPGSVALPPAGVPNTPNYAWTHYLEDGSEKLECGDTSTALVSGFGCMGNDCDDVRLYCRTSDSASSERSTTTSTWTAAHVSDETEPLICDDDYFMTGVACHGYRCDNIKMLCTHREGRVSGDCSWSGWLSEEGTGSITFTFDEALAIRGIECRDPFCGEMRFYVCSYSHLENMTTAPAPQAPVAPLTAFPTNTVGTCGPEDFAGECTHTEACHTMYPDARDCWQDGGGVCMCGHAACGCL